MTRYPYEGRFPDQAGMSNAGATGHTQGMSERPDHGGMIAGLAGVLDTINAGSAGLPALNRLLTVAQASLGADGMSFAEYGPTGARVIATTGAAEWALGRALDLTDPALVALRAGPRTQDVSLDRLPRWLAGQLSGRGLFRVFYCRAELGSLAIGHVHAYFRDASGRASPEQHALIRLVAACAAHQYADSAGLPVHGDGPVVAALSDGLAIVDRDGWVRLWNPAAEQVTGQRAEEMLGRPLPFPVPAENEVLEHPLPDGRWLKVTGGVLPGTGESRVVTFSDATEQHRREHDRELFIAVTSHELRTPVTAIKGYADTLTNHWDSLDETDRREALRVIGQRSAELARLLDRLLSAATDAGAVGGRPPGPFDLVDALRAAVAELPAELRQRLTVDLPVDLPKALGDRASLATVLTELMTNADKYTDDNALPVELCAGADAQSVFFRVSDRGVGVRPEHVERAFDRFWQGESGNRRRYPGAGLGLYLVRRIIERQNGWASLRPREGGGTVAEVRLPRGDVLLSGEA
jgi:two-component system, OmpR family, phosphate regulon sensor histidine kinase PhoR